jgi:hypothetical protein
VTLIGAELRRDGAATFSPPLVGPLWGRVGAREIWQRGSLPGAGRDGRMRDRMSLRAEAVFRSHRFKTNPKNW